jgi:formylmethanofuran dehydrogenase subunit E
MAMTDLDIEQLEQMMAALPKTCDQCGEMKSGDQLNYFADGHKVCDQCFAANSEKPSKPQQQ